MSLIVYLLLTGQMIDSGHLSRADVGVLERVAQRRMVNGWGLETVSLDRYDALIATPDCKYLGHDGWIVIGNDAYQVLVVDCAQVKHRREMIANDLLADINRPELVHQEAMLILEEEQKSHPGGWR